MKPNIVARLALFAELHALEVDLRCSRVDTVFALADIDTQLDRVIGEQADLREVTCEKQTRYSGL